MIFRPFLLPLSNVSIGTEGREGIRICVGLRTWQGLNSLSILMSRASLPVSEWITVFF